MKEEKEGTGLKQVFSPLGIWALSIGTAIGWGSFVVTCDTYLLKSGLLGTVFGLLAGMAVILVITTNLRYMVDSGPNAGGVYAFIRQRRGRDLGFISLWFVLLTYMAILWANMTSVPLFARFFLGDTFKFGFSYSIFGYDVWLGEALLSICAIVITGLICANTMRLPGRIVSVAAIIFAIAFAFCAVMAVLRHGSGFSYEPYFTEGSGAFAQIVRIAAISPWAFIGFENVSHFSEEYDFPVRKIKGILISSVLVTTALYILVSLLSISAYPPEYASWIEYIGDMDNLEGIKAVPAFYAAGYYLGDAGVAVLMVALFCVIITSLIGNLLAVSRLLYAAGREGDAPRKLQKLNKKGIPAPAICLIVAVSLLIPFIGRTAIGWIVDVTTLGATIIYGLISYGVYRMGIAMRKTKERYFGLAGMGLMILFALLILVPGLLPFDAMETESYMLFIIWAVLGLIYFRVLLKRDTGRKYSQRIIVWIVMMVMVLFASMMWVSRETEKAANQAVEHIFEYHQSHPETDSSEDESAARNAFLMQQAKNISSTNRLYTVVSLGIFGIFIIMMMNNHQDTKLLDQKLSAAVRVANVDPLTGVRNRHAYLDEEEKIERLIQNGEAPPFAVIILDVNDLKKVNDNLGHQAGDKFIQDACKIICNNFKRSPVFRIGGDEFCVVSRGDDYNNLDKLMENMHTRNAEAKKNGGIVIACGMSRYDDDGAVAPVFERADQDMYENKSRLKEGKE